MSDKTNYRSLLKAFFKQKLDFQSIYKQIPQNLLQQQYIPLEIAINILSMYITYLY